MEGIALRDVPTITSVKYSPELRSAVRRIVERARHLYSGELEISEYEPDLDLPHLPGDSPRLNIVEAVVVKRLFFGLIPLKDRRVVFDVLPGYSLHHLYKDFSRVLEYGVRDKKILEIAIEEMDQCARSLGARAALCTRP